MGRQKVVAAVRRGCETGGKIAPKAIKVTKRKAALELAHAAGERAMAALRKKRHITTEQPEKEEDELLNAEWEEGGGEEEEEGKEEGEEEEGEGGGNIEEQESQCKQSEFQKRR
jgi:hypothetical protein